MDVEGGPKSFGDVEVQPLWMGCGRALETRPSHTCYHTEFGRSGSNLWR